MTIGLDLGDRSSYHCVLDEAGEVLLEQKVRAISQGDKRNFRGTPTHFGRSDSVPTASSYNAHGNVAFVAIDSN